MSDNAYSPNSAPSGSYGPGSFGSGSYAPVGVDPNRPAWAPAAGPDTPPPAWAPPEPPPWAGEPANAAPGANAAPEANADPAMYADPAAGGQPAGVVPEFAGADPEFGGPAPEFGGPGPDPLAGDVDLDLGMDDDDDEGQADGLDMRVLVEWVDTHIASIVARKVPTTGGYPRWCRQWWFHAEAIVRFESLRHAWMDLIGRPGTAKLSYFRDFLDPTLMTLMADDGPFGRCTPTKHIDHEPIGQDVPPPELFD